MQCCYTAEQWQHLCDAFDIFIQTHDNSKFRLFLFGSLSTCEISKDTRLGKSPNAKSKLVYGWKRAFFGTHKNAAHGEGGAATLIKDPSEAVRGLEILFRSYKGRVQVYDNHKRYIDCHEGFFQLMKSEAIGYKKYRLTILKTDKVPLYAFTHDPRYHNLNFYKPTEKYAVAIAKTIKDFRILIGNNDVGSPYIIDMYNIDGIYMGYTKVDSTFQNISYHLVDDVE